MSTTKKNNSSTNRVNITNKTAKKGYYSVPNLSKYKNMSNITSSYNKSKS